MRLIVRTQGHYQRYDIRRPDAGLMETVWKFGIGKVSRLTRSGTRSSLPRWNAGLPCGRRVLLAAWLQIASHCALPRRTMVSVCMRAQPFGSPLAIVRSNGNAKISSNLEPVSGFEPLTIRLQGTVMRSRNVGGHGCTGHLAASTVACGRPVSLTVCPRWLPVWLPAPGGPTPPGYKHVTAPIGRRTSGSYRFPAPVPIAARVQPSHACGGHP